MLKLGERESIKAMRKLVMFMIELLKNIQGCRNDFSSEGAKSRDQLKR